MPFYECMRYVEYTQMYIKVQWLLYNTRHVYTMLCIHTCICTHSTCIYVYTVPTLGHTLAH